MNQEVKERWLKALRSGEYPKVRGYLKTLEGYCCLGVLCDLYSKETGIQWDNYDGSYSFMGADGVPPPKVKNWADTNPTFPSVKFKGILFNLQTLNDYERLTFNEIADLIEEQY